MPLINVFTSADTSDAAKSEGLLSEISQAVSTSLSKSERWVMACLVPRTRMRFAGSDAPACYVEVKSIGHMTPELTRRMSSDICRIVASTLGVKSDRVYVEFADEEAHLWGYDGSTFG